MQYITGKQLISIFLLLMAPYVYGQELITLTNSLKADTHITFNFQYTDTLLSNENSTFDFGVITPGQTRTFYSEQLPDKFHLPGIAINQINGILVNVNKNHIYLEADSGPIPITNQHAVIENNPSKNSADLPYLLAIK